MRKAVVMLGLVGLAVGYAAAGEPIDVVVPKQKTVLFNGKDFAGWKKFIPNKGVDVDKVWTIKDGVIHCLGKPNGYIRTTTRYGNYKLHVEWRWTGKPTNSGCLLHAQLPDRTWPKCVEAQMMNQNAGDFWLLTHSTITVDGKKVGPKMYANVKKKHPSNEKPQGEWNSYDITCDGGTVRLMVNGLLQNEGTEADPSHGYICLQSEGSPIEFRNVYLEPLKSE